MFPEDFADGVVGTISTALTGLFSAGSFTYDVSPSISQTIFDSGRNRNNVRLAEANSWRRSQLREGDPDRIPRSRRCALPSAARSASRCRRRRSGWTQPRSRRGCPTRASASASPRSSMLWCRGARPYAAQQQLVTRALNRDLNLVELYRSLGGGLS